MTGQKGSEPRDGGSRAVQLGGFRDEISSSSNPNREAIARIIERAVVGGGKDFDTSPLEWADLILALQPNRGSGEGVLLSQPCGDGAHSPSSPGGPMTSSDKPTPTHRGGDIMGTAAEATAALEERARQWREYRQPRIATAKEHKRLEALEREAQVRLANAALLWLWHRENTPPSDLGG